MLCKRGSILAIIRAMRDGGDWRGKDSSKKALDRPRRYFGLLIDVNYASAGLLSRS